MEAALDLAYCPRNLQVTGIKKLRSTEVWIKSFGRLSRHLMGQIPKESPNKIHMSMLKAMILR